MNYTFLFFVNSLLLGIGLSMDAFSVSLADGLNEPLMKKGKKILIAFDFGFFQFAMPILGWFLVHFFIEKFNAFSKWIPWIALILLSFIGGKMLYEGIKNKEEEGRKGTGFITLLLQGIATSIDALSVGFTIADDPYDGALVASIIIGITTFLLSLLGIEIGKKFGLKFKKGATIAGGIILITIGIEIFLKGIL